jgi:type IX secretion system PorP/SprF family membrane protein
MKLKLIIVALLFVGINANAQQLNFFSQYMIDNYNINPAAAGMYDYMPISLQVRQQWVGFNEAPKTQQISTHMNIKDHHGAGLKLYNDVLGPLNRISAQGTYAYHVEIDRDYHLSFGLSFMMNQHKLNASGFNIQSQTDQTLNQAGYTSTNFDADFGALFYADEFYIGFSAPQLFQNKYKFTDTLSALSKQVRHYYISGGYKIEANRDWKVEPVFLIKAVQNAPLQADISARVHYKDMFWGGASWRIKDAVSIMAGMVYEGFVFGYSFDFTTNDIRNYSSGTHEIYLGYRIPSKKLPGFSRY